MNTGSRGNLGKLKIWIDITNSPHVLFFYPLVKEFEKRGHTVEITSRDYAQAIPLLAELGLKHRKIGKHQGKNIFKKALGLLSRSSRLFFFGFGQGFDLAISHSSNDLSVAAWLLRIPHIVMFDYEYAELSHRLNLKLASRALIPDSIPVDSLLGYGISKSKVDQYKGLKEQVYLPGRKFDKRVRERLNINTEKVVITARPPATMSAYHRFENELFDEILKKLSENPDVVIVLLPRTDKQRDKYRRLGNKNVIIPEEAVDGPSLISSSDLVIGAGGTINREAVALGVPAYTIFKGKMGAIDKRLIEEGKLHMVKSLKDIKLAKKDVREIRLDSNLMEVADKILATVRKSIL